MIDHKSVKEFQDLIDRRILRFKNEKLPFIAPELMEIHWNEFRKEMKFYIEQFCDKQP